MIATLRTLPPALQQTLIYASALALSKAFSLLMIPVATRFLTLEDYGRLDVLQTLADLLGIVIGMGLTEIMFRFAGSTPDETSQRQIAANILGLAVTLAVFTLILTQLCAPAITQLLPGNINQAECRIILLSLALSNLILVPLAWLRLRGRPWIYLIGTAGQVGLQVLLAIVLLNWGFGISGVLWGGLIASLVSSIWLLHKQWQDTGIAFEWLQFKSFGAYGGPLIFVGIAGFILGSFDRWILADAVGTAEMALYALATKFGLITAVLIQPFDLWWHARRFAVLTESHGKFRCAQTAEIGIALAMLAALVIAALGPWLVTILTPETYQGAIPYIAWLTGLAAIHNINASLGFGTMSQQNTRWPAIIDGSAACIAVIGYFSLIPTYGAYGAISATAIALISRCIATLIISQRLLPLPYRLPQLSVLAVVTALGLVLMPETTGVIPAIHSLAIIGLTLALAALLKLIPLRCRER